MDPGAPTPVLESIDLTTVHATQQATDRPASTVGIREVLTAWRAAERELDDLPDDSPEWPDVHARVVGLRASYHQLFSEARDRRPSVEDRWRDGGRPVMAVGYQLLEAR